MKKTIKMMLFFASAIVLLASCKEDPNPPVAGFTLSNETLIQWDKTTITSTATGADEITYTVTGGEFEMDEVTLTIQFLEAKTYTVTQAATNADGTTESSQEVVVTEPDNTYNMSYYGTSELAIVGQPIWFSATQIRIGGEGVTAQEADTIKVFPDMGLDPFYGTGTRSYTFDANGGSGTYIGEFTHYPTSDGGWDAAWGFGLASAGDGLEVTLIYAPEGATDEADYVYDITMSNTTIDGFYDAMFAQHLDDPSILTFTYRGKITPLQ